MIPGLLNRLSAVHAYVEHHDRCARHPRQQYPAYLGHITRPAGPINRERAVVSLGDALRHHLQSAQPAARGTPLRCAEAQTLDHFAGPLAVERRGVHHHNFPVACIPGNRHDYPMPERPDARLLLRQKLIHDTASIFFKAQRRSQHANYAVDQRRDDGNLNSPAPRQLGQTRVIVRADRRFGFLALYVAVFHLPIVYRVSPVPPPRWRANQLTSTANTGASRGIASFLVCSAVFAASFAALAVRADNPPADAIGVIEGEAISVDGPMSVEVGRGQVKTLF